MKLDNNRILGMAMVVALLAIGSGSCVNPEYWEAKQREKTLSGSIVRSNEPYRVKGQLDGETLKHESGEPIVFMSVGAPSDDHVTFSIWGSYSCLPMASDVFVVTTSEILLSGKAGDVTFSSQATITVNRDILCSGRITGWLKHEPETRTIDPFRLQGLLVIEWNDPDTSCLHSLIIDTFHL